MQAPNLSKQALWRDFKQVLLRTQFIPSSATSSKQHLVLLSFFFLLAKTGSAGLQRQNILMCLWPATCCFVCFYVVFVPHCHLGLGRGVCCGRLFVVFWRCHMWRRVCCGQLLVVFWHCHMWRHVCCDQLFVAFWLHVCVTSVCCGGLLVVFWRCHMCHICCAQLLSLWPFSTWPTLITPCPGSRENWHCLTLFCTYNALQHCMTLQCIGWDVCMECSSVLFVRMLFYIARHTGEKSHTSSCGLFCLFSLIWYVVRSNCHIWWFNQFSLYHFKS